MAKRSGKRKKKKTSGRRSSAVRRTIYRDSGSGQFAKKASWNRSRAHGGDRFKRESVLFAPSKTARSAPIPKTKMRPIPTERAGKETRPEIPTPAKKSRKLIKTLSEFLMEELEEGEWDDYESSADYNEDAINE